MSYNPYFFELAKQAAGKAAENGIHVDPKWIYAQWHIETGGFTSELQATHHNLGGIASSSSGWMHFNTFEEFANYFGNYLALYTEEGIQKADSLYTYLAALQKGGYFSADLNIYYEACLNIINTLVM